MISLFVFSTSCGLYKKTDSATNPINDAEKRKKNIEEGKIIRFGGKKKTGEFGFASSNEMWRASVDILDFVPLTIADYGGGIIITDWFANEQVVNESIKTTVQFLSNEIRSDGLKIVIHKKNCKSDISCSVKTVSSELNNEIKLAILRKAAKLQSEDRKKKASEKGPYIEPNN